MPTITLSTTIRAPRERVFDLARSIDLHLASTAGSGERVVAGVTHGCIGPGEEVTWSARHLGVRQRLRVRITAFAPPRHFTDTMIEGTFAAMEHRHDFEEHGMGTLMRDTFLFRSPAGIIGRLVDALVLTRYLTRLLIARNRVLTTVAESAAWQQYLAPSGAAAGGRAQEDGRTRS